MGRQINFYLDTADQNHYVNGLITELGCVFLADRNNTPGPRVASPIGTGLVYFTIPSLLSRVKMRRTGGSEASWSIDSFNTAAFEFLRCSERDGSVNRGRIYIDSSSFSKTNGQGDIEILHWVDQVLRWTKTTMVLTHLGAGLPEYTMYHSLERLNNGTLRFENISAAYLQQF